MEAVVKGIRTLSLNLLFANNSEIVDTMAAEICIHIEYGVRVIIRIIVVIKKAILPSRDLL